LRAAIIQQQQGRPAFGTAFQKVANNLLLHSDCHEGFAFVLPISDRELVKKYECMIDFLFCELFCGPWPSRCQKFYQGLGPPLTGYATKRKVTEYEAILLHAMNLIVMFRHVRQHITWGEFRSAVLRDDRHGRSASRRAVSKMRAIDARPRS